MGIVRKILPFLRKKDEAQPEIKKVAVIANIVDQSSLLAATLYTLVKRRHGEQEVCLVDIRDAFPEADQYVWMDCGSPSHLKEYFMGLLQVQGTHQAAQRAWYDTVIKKSLHLTSLPAQTEDPDPACTVIGHALYQLVKEGLLQEDEIGPYMRFSVLSIAFHTDKIEKEDVVAFYDLLEMAYQYYLGQNLSLEHFLHSSAPAQLEVDLFIEHQKAVNRAMVSKVREIVVGHRSVHYVTTVGPEVHGLIRRLRLAKKEFIHMSMGSYGSVLYASIPVPAELSEHKALLRLTPEVEAVRKFRQ